MKIVRAGQPEEPEFIGECVRCGTIILFGTDECRIERGTITYRWVECPICRRDFPVKADSVEARG